MQKQQFRTDKKIAFDDIFGLTNGNRNRIKTYQSCVEFGPELKSCRVLRFGGIEIEENGMLETIAPPGATVTPGPLGVVDFGNIAALLGISQQTLERLTRTDATFPKLFKIANKRHCRFADLQGWIDRKAKGDV